MNITKNNLLNQFAAKISQMNPFKSSNSTINEVLFYGSENEEQGQKVGLNNLCCIYYLIIHASKTVDVCMPSLRSETILNSLLAVQKNNKAIVRVVVHNSESSENLTALEQNGIEVKLVTEEKLEHNFILIDAASRDSVAVLGSLDYETNRVNQNRDTTVLTSDSTVVKALKREFERVWKSVPSK